MQSSVVFEFSKLFPSTLATAAKQYPNILQKLEEFVNSKTSNPLQQFGSNDKSFAGGTLLKYLPKARKAHLNSDVSIIYEMSGKNPTKIWVDGVFSHRDLGTSTTSKQNVQKNVAKQIINNRLHENQ